MVQQFMVASVGLHGSDPAGNLAVLNLTDPQGKELRVFVPLAQQVAVLAAYQASCLASAQQRKGKAPSGVLNAMKAEGPRLMLGPTGKLSIALPLESGPELTIPVTRQGLEELLRAGTEALAHLDAGGSTMNN